MGTCFGKKPSRLNDIDNLNLKGSEQPPIKEFSKLNHTNSFNSNGNNNINSKRLNSSSFKSNGNPAQHAVNKLNGNINGSISTTTTSGASTNNGDSNSFRFANSSQQPSINPNEPNQVKQADEKNLNGQVVLNYYSKQPSDQNCNNKFNKNAYIALFDYAARTMEDLSFKKGDILYVNEQDKKSDGWWLARLRSNSNQSDDKIKCGYIPAKYVAELDSLESEPWYFGNTKRMEAEKLLMLENNQHGSYLIRISDGSNHAYSLSVRDMDSVKHYRIRRSEEDGCYFITKRVTFENLSHLVSYYSKKPDGLWVQLMKPCVKIDQPITEGLTHSFIKDFEVDRKLFHLERKIGQGQFGDVWQGVYKMNNMKVAIKTLKEGMNPSDFKAEAALMRNLSHSKLIQLYALCTTEEPIYIVTELMTNGSLLDYLQTPVGKRLQIDTQIYIASQIADGMAYLESKNYIHRDLAARNVLVGDNNEVKVADFGLARVLKDLNIYAAREGTKFPIKWTAPEAAIFNKFSVKSDVWSFGIVLTEIVTHGRTPYPSMSNQEVLQQVSRSYRMPQPPNCPDRLYQIMLNCWKTNAEERPTFEALKYILENFLDEDESRQYRYTHNNGANN